MQDFLWTQVQDIGPGARAGHGAAHDAVRNRTVVFGGLDSGPLGDTWELVDDLWTQVEETGPTARYGCAMAFDAARGHVVLFGGQTGTSLLRDTWRWDGQYWTQIEDTGPSPRSGHAMAFDASSQRVVLFGGQTGIGLAGDTWGWDGGGWTQLEDTGPSPRRAHALGNDIDPGRILLFGGAGAGDAGLSDTWVWGGTTWTKVQDAGPTARAGGALVSVAGKVFLFGGVDFLDETVPIASHVLYGDTWQWDGSVWTQVQDIGPAARWRHAITSDDSRRIVLFGGLSQFAPFGGPIGGGLLGDTWSSVVQEDAIHVSPSGNDADPGTRQSPFVTIAAAVAAAAGTGREVRVAAGSYDQGAGLVVPGDIAILGGYDPVTWVRSATSVTQLVGVPQAVLADGATNVTLDELTLNAFAAGGSVYGVRAVNGSSVRLINVSVTAGDGTLGPVGIAGSPGIAGANGLPGGLGTCDGDIPGMGGPGVRARSAGPARPEVQEASPVVAA